MFTPYPEDRVEAGLRRIAEVLEMPKMAANVICDTDEKQRQEWLHWSQCVVTGIPTQQFSDLFPVEAIQRFCDTNHLPLPGLQPVIKADVIPSVWETLTRAEREAGHFATGDPAIYWKQIPPQENPPVHYRENYLRLRALPVAINVLLHAFETDSLVYQRELNAKQNAETAEFMERLLSRGT